MLDTQDVPIDAVMPSTTQTVLNIVLGLLVAGELVHSIRDSRRRRDLIPIFIMIGAGLAVFWEPLGDYLIKAYYPERGQDTLFTALDRDMPVFVGLLFILYMSVGPLVLLRAAAKGITPKQWWTTCVSLVVGLLVFEMLALEIGGDAWIYYGEETKVLGVPVFAVASNAGFVVVIAAGAAALARFLPRRQQWLMIPGVSLLFFAGHAMMTLPHTIGLYDGDSKLWGDLGGLGSTVLAVIVSHICSLAFRKPWPPQPGDSSPDGDGKVAVDPARRTSVAA